MPEVSPAAAKTGLASRRSAVLAGWISCMRSVEVTWCPEVHASPHRGTNDPEIPVPIRFSDSDGSPTRTRTRQTGDAERKSDE